MGKKATNKEAPAPVTDTNTPASNEARLEAAQRVFTQMNDAQSKEDVVAIVTENVGTLGHRIIGRMILGATPEKALRLDKNPAK